MKNLTNILVVLFGLVALTACVKDTMHHSNGYYSSGGSGRVSSYSSQAPANNSSGYYSSSGSADSSVSNSYSRSETGAGGSYYSGSK